MTDIAKCNGENCLLKEKCWRFTSPVNMTKQLWFIPPYDEEKEWCEYFWDNKEKNESKKRMAIK